MIRNVSTIEGSHCVSVFFIFTFEFILNLSMSDPLGLFVSLLFCLFHSCFVCFIVVLLFTIAFHAFVDIEITKPGKFDDLALKSQIKSSPK